MKNFFLFFFLLFLLSSSHAHLDAGEDVTIGAFVLDFGHSPSQLIQNQSAILAFNLGKAGTQEAADYQSVWVRISSPTKVEFAGTLESENNSSSISYTFAETGNYEITVRYNTIEKILLQHTFQVNVQSAPETQSPQSILWIGLSFFFFILGMILSPYLIHIIRK